MEIFDIIVAVNRLKEKIMDLSSKIDNLAASPSQQLNKKYLDEVAACKLLRVSPRTLARMRTAGTIPYIRIRRRILFHSSDLNDYLDNKCRNI